MTTDTTNSTAAPKSPKMRTITLTGRPPVRINEEKWGLIARASWDSYGSGDYGRHYQAKQQGELDECHLRVRENEAETKWIVYGTYSEGWHSDHSGLSAAGELIDDRDNIPATIERVGQALGAPAQLIADCISDLPAEEI